MKKAPKEIRIVKHYYKDDPKFFGDYISIQLWIDGKCVYNLDDDYHDKGEDKIEGFKECLFYIYGYGKLPEIKTISLADIED